MDSGHPVDKNIYLRNYYVIRVEAAFLINDYFVDSNLSTPANFKAIHVEAALFEPYYK
ncbi:MAG: hypothetical protein ACJAWQ_000596 [Paraglaciecola sp.]